MTTGHEAPAAPRAPAGGQQGVAHLAWTSGWDSTFRLLQLLATTDCLIQPWYILFEERQSTGTEFARMEEIRRLAGAHRAGWAERILPSRYRGGAELRRIAGHRNAQVDRVRQHYVVGEQYRCIAALADAEGIDGLELSYLSTHGPLGARFLADSVVVDSPGGKVRRLPASLVGTELELFLPFAFPMLGRTKADLGAEARQLGVLEILERSWFCHRPIHGEACGTCGPCAYAIEHEMAYRLGVGGRLRFQGLRVRRFLGIGYRKPASQQSAPKPATQAAAHS